MPSNAATLHYRHEKLVDIIDFSSTDDITLPVANVESNWISVRPDGNLRTMVSVVIMQVRLAFQLPFIFP